MDLKRLRTFVAVADLGTESKAALRLRISQSALSRQIGDLEYECGFKLFDRIGRRLFLTARGEQLLGDCRGVLGQLGSLGERIELLKRGDSGVLKVAAPPRSRVSRIGESRCGTATSSNGTSGVRCRAMLRTFARRSPPICATSSRSPVRRRASRRKQTRSASRLKLT